MVTDSGVDSFLFAAAFALVTSEKHLLTPVSEKPCFAERQRLYTVPISGYDLRRF
jgi:hypothetical protein